MENTTTTIPNQLYNDTNSTANRNSTMDLQPQLQPQPNGDIRELWKIADRIPTFEGNSEDNVVTWLQQWQHALNGRAYPVRDLVLALTSRLRGRANEWYFEEIAPYGVATINMLMDQLRNKFFNEDTKAVNRLALEHYINKGQGKLTAEQYFVEFSKRLKLIDKPPQRQCIDMLIKGLRPDLRNKASALQAVNALGANLNTAYESIKRLEFAIIDKGKNTINAVTAGEETDFEYRQTQYIQPNTTAYTQTSSTPYTTAHTGSVPYNGGAPFYAQHQQQVNTAPQTPYIPQVTPHIQQKEAFEIAQLTSRLEVLEAYNKGLANGRYYTTLCFTCYRCYMSTRCGVLPYVRLGYHCISVMVRTK